MNNMLGYLLRRFCVRADVTKYAATVVDLARDELSQVVAAANAASAAGARSTPLYVSTAPLRVVLIL